MTNSMTFVLQGVDNLSGVMDRAGGASDRLARRLLKLGAVGVGPALGASVAAATGAMVAGFASAGAAAGAFGAAVKPQIKLMSDNAKAAEKLADAQETAARKKRVAAELEAKGSDLAEKAQKAYTSARLAAVDAEKAYQRQTKDMPKETAAAALSMAKLKMAHEDWSASLAKDTMPLFTRGIDGARKALPYLTPLVRTTSRALSDFMDGLDGGGLKGFLDKLDRAAKETLPDLLSTGRNVFVGIGGIIEAFLPSSDRFTGGLEKGSAAFAKWGQALKDSEGFQRFTDIASEGSGSLKQLAAAGFELYEALRPIAGTWVDIAEGAAKFIRWLPPETLAYIAGSLIAVKLATLGVNAALLLLNANPVTLTVGAVVLLGAAFVTAWQKSQRFREIASSAMAVVAQVVLGQTRVMLLGFQAFAGTAVDSMVGVVEVANDMFGNLPGIGPMVRDAAKAARNFKDNTSGYFQDAIDKVDGYSRAVEQMPTKIRLDGDISKLDDKLATAQAKVDSLKQKRKTAVGADKSRLDDQISKAQAKVDSLKQKRAAKVAARDEASPVINRVQGKLKEPKDRTVNVKARDLASSVIGGVSGRLAGLRSRTVTVTAVYKQVGSAIGGAALGVGGATGGLYTGGGFKHRGYSKGGLVDGPGTETSDDVWAPWLSKNEFVVNARRTREYLPLLKAINTGQLKAGTFAGSSGTAGAGMEAGRGLAAGMQGAVRLVADAAARMASGVTAGIRDELEIRSPSKKTKALAQDVAKGFLQGLTGSRDKIKSTSADLVKDIRTAFSGRKESGLVRMVNQQTKKLLDQAAKRDAIAKKIAEAKSYAADVTRTARDQAGLSSLGMDANEVTAGGIKGGLASKLAQIKQFSKYIDILAKRGLNKGLLRQILNMGPEAGYAYASALAGADKSTIASVNKTQAAIDSESKKLGNKGADILYDSGKNAGKGFLKGLEGQQKDIEKLMLKIAQGMQKSIKKALGIKSPSTVMARLGAYSTEGLARGLMDAAPQVDRSMAAIAGRVSGIQPVPGRAAVAGRAGGGMVVHVTVEVPPTVDRGAVGREIQGVLLTLKRNLGGADLGIG